MQELQGIIDEYPQARAWLRLMAKKDVELADHAERTAVWARKTAQALQLAAGEVEKISLVGLLHDVGKLLLPQKLLMKASPLTDEEARTMRLHPVLGAQLVMQNEDFAYLANAVRHEHERWDGSGYPDGLRGTAIPLPSRVVAVCDTFDAVTADRPYRKGRSWDAGEKVLVRGADSQFDGAAVKAFVVVLREERK